MNEHTPDLITDLIIDISSAESESISEFRSKVREVFEDLREEYPLIWDLYERFSSLIGGISFDSEQQILVQLLNSSERIVLGESEEDGLLETAENLIGELEQTESRRQKTEVSTDHETGVHPEVSIDDLALQIVNIEPDDKEGLKTARGMCSDILKEKFYTDGILKIIKHTSNEISKLIRKRSRGLDELYASISGLVEKAEIEHEIVKSEESNQSSVISDQCREEKTGESDQSEGQKTGESNQLSVISNQSEEVEAAVESAMLPDDLDEELLGKCIEESNDLMQRAEEALLLLEENPDDIESLNRVFRCFHTIKGSASYLGIPFVPELSHSAEGLLHKVREKEIPFTDTIADLALRSVDALKTLLSNVQRSISSNLPIDPSPDHGELLHHLTHHKQSADRKADRDPEESNQSSVISNQNGEENNAEPGTGNAERETGNTAEGTGGAERRSGTEDRRQGAEESNQSSVISNQNGEDPITANRGKPSASGPLPVTGQAEDRRLGNGDRRNGNGDRRQNSAAQTAQDSSVRIKTDRLDSLIDMVGELVIAQSMVRQDERVLDTGNYELLRKVTHAGKIVRDLQDLSLSMRMVPFQQTFLKMNRLVRDLSHKSGKKIQFITEGEDTEIDRNMVDVVNEPLVHLLRNAVDHGIETENERKTAGKPATAAVSLNAYSMGGNIVVEVRDDGKGISLSSLEKKAISKGLLSPGHNRTEREIMNLIFEPGFSTLDTVTDISGRGVGLDVVKKSLEQLRGSIEVSSMEGAGTLFSLRIPLTLAITDGMILCVGEERYIIPTANIETTVRPDARMIQTVAGRGEMCDYRGMMLPFIRLHRAFGVADACTEPTDGLCVVVSEAERKFALFVDSLLGQAQVVIKSLGDGIGNVGGVSGGAILGDGKVGLILDPTGLWEMVRSGRTETSDSYKEELVYG